jgi:hypothetical protein
MVFVKGILQLSHVDQMQILAPPPSINVSPRDVRTRRDAHSNVGRSFFFALPYRNDKCCMELVRG